MASTDQSNYSLTNHLADKNFNPTPFIRSQFKTNEGFSVATYGGNSSEFQTDNQSNILNEINQRIFATEQEILDAEKQIEAEIRQLELEEEVTQSTMLYEVDEFLAQFSSIKNDLRECIRSTTQNNEEVSAAGNELQTLNDLKSEKEIMSSLCDLLIETVSEDGNIDLNRNSFKRYESINLG